MKICCALLLTFTCAEIFCAKAMSYEFRAGDRRDPFTIAVRPQIRADEKEIVQVDFSKNMRDAQLWLSDAEAAALERRSGTCMQKCDQALAALKEVTSNDPSAEVLRQNLLRLRRAAESMQQRVEAVAAFAKLNVNVTGVVARPRKAQAIVNGVLVHEGQTLTASDNETLLIEKISSGQIVLNFRGYRMAAAVTAAE